MARARATAAARFTGTSVGVAGGKETRKGGRRRRRAKVPYNAWMADTKEAWEGVGDALSALGLKLKLHTEQEMSEDGKEFTSALERLVGTVNDIFQGVGNAARDPAVRDDAKSVAQAFAGAVDATIAEATSRLKKSD